MVDNSYFFVVSCEVQPSRDKGLLYRFENDSFFKQTSIPKGNSKIKISRFNQTSWVSQAFPLAAFFQTVWVPLPDFNRYYALLRDSCFFISFFFYCTIFYYISYYRYLE